MSVNRVASSVRYVKAFPLDETSGIDHVLIPENKLGVITVRRANSRLDDSHSVVVGENEYTISGDATRQLDVIG